QREPLEPPGQLLQGPGVLDPVSAHPGAAQPGQVAAGAQSGAEIACQRPDVGAAGAADGRVDVEQISVTMCPGDRELVDGHRPRLELGRGARPGQPVGALAVDLDRADRGRAAALAGAAGGGALPVVPGSPGAGFGELSRETARRRRATGDLAFRVV